nr:hypothetical protein Iba_chr11bCG10150 [Ipomoea batatas]
MSIEDLLLETVRGNSYLDSDAESHGYYRSWGGFGSLGCRDSPTVIQESFDERVRMLSLLREERRMLILVQIGFVAIWRTFKQGERKSDGNGTGGAITPQMKSNQMPMSRMRKIGDEPETLCNT